MAGTTGTITHRQWRTEMNGFLEFLETGIAGVLERMEASVRAVRGGRDHLAQIAACRIAVADWIAAGRQLVAAEDARQVPVADAQAAAGGTDEVAGDKRYNQAG